MSWRSSSCVALVWLAGSSCVKLAYCQDVVLYDGCNLEDYYDGMLSSDGTSLRDDVTRQDLEELLESTHRKVLPYTNNDSDDVWKALIDLDRGDNGDDTVQLLYKQESIAALPHGTAGTWNREHLWPKSRGVEYTGADFTDIHHLRPADWNVNAARSNLYFGECGVAEAASNCDSPAHEEATEDTASDSTIFRPPAIVRGDIARAIFYMDMRYSNQNNDGLDLSVTDCPNDEPNEMAYKSALLEWHQADSVTDAERQRNQRACERWQGNRNVFVDFPDLVEKFFGSPQTPLGEGLGYPGCDTNAVESTPSTSSESNSAPASDACNDLSPGDVMVIAMHSDTPDLVAFVALKDLPGDGLQLFLTDNAWTGSSFRTNEGTVSLQIPSMIAAGTVFGYEGPDSTTGGVSVLYGDEWTKVGGQFQLSTSGDNLFLYCLNSQNEVRFLSGLEFSGNGWMSSSLNEDEYGSSGSALPDQLSAEYAISLSHSDNYRYMGIMEGSTEEIQAQIFDINQWEGSDSLDSSALPTQFTLSSSSSPGPVSPGDVMVVAMQSKNPDMVALVALKDLPGDLKLYMTDNAWTGTDFRSNEGTIMLTLPSSGIDAGTTFGYGSDLLYGSDWQSVGGRFALSESGDTILIYTKDDDDNIQHLAAFDYTGGWTEEGLSGDDYGTDKSTLPAGLESAEAAKSLPYDSGYFYTGPTEGDRAFLLESIRDDTNWEGSDPGRTGTFNVTETTSSASAQRRGFVGHARIHLFLLSPLLAACLGHLSVLV